MKARDGQSEPGIFLLWSMTINYSVHSLRSQPASCVSEWIRRTVDLEGQWMSIGVMETSSSLAPAGTKSDCLRNDASAAHVYDATDEKSCGQILREWLLLDDGRL